MNKHFYTLILSVCTAFFLMVACQAPALDEEILRPEEPEQSIETPARSTVPFSISVNTGATRVSYAEGTYQFKEGDKLRVVGVDRADIQGDLSKNGEVWTGELSFDTDKGEPVEGETKLKVTLIHVDNPDASTYSSTIVAEVTDGRSNLLQEAVELYSLFVTDEDVVFSSKDVVDVSLQQQATFLDVTVRFKFDGSHEVQPGNALVDLVTPLGEAKGEAGFVGDGADFDVHFMAVVPGGQKLNSFKLTVADRQIEFTDSTIEMVRNRKYSINRTVVYSPQLGDPFWSDGTYGRLRHADPDVQIVGIVVYVNHNYLDEDKAVIDDAITEKNADGKGKYGHGLVMALKNVATGVKWSKSKGTKYTDNLISKPSHTLEAGNLSGYKNSQAISSAEIESAAYLAMQCDEPVSKDYTTGWFLPSIGQWMYTISTDGFGGANPADEWLVNNSTKKWLVEGQIGNLILVKERADKQVNDLIKSLNDRLEVLKTDFGIEYDSFGDPDAAHNYSDNYWTSSENSGSNALRMNLGTVEGPYNGGKYYSSIKVAAVSKTDIYGTGNYKMKVRPFLAF